MMLADLDQIVRRVGRIGEILLGLHLVRLRCDEDFPRAVELRARRSASSSAMAPGGVRL